jgi:very-short-patch-repair endonuclease
MGRDRDGGAGMMGPRTGTGIVLGQTVNPEKVRRSREHRRDMTPEEATLWHYLRNNRLAGLAFRRQQVIDGFIADLFCAAARLVVEVDGAAHLAQADYDAERGRILHARSLRVLRVSNNDIRQRLPTVLQRIRESCDLA